MSDPVKILLRIIRTLVATYPEVRAWLAEMQDPQSKAAEQVRRILGDDPFDKRPWE